MPGSMPKMTRRTFLGLAAGAATSAVLCRPEAAMAADVDWSGEPVATDAAGEETLEHARWRMENDLPSSFRYDEGKPVAEPDSGATTTVNGPRHAPSASGTPAVSRTGIDVSYAQGTIDWDKAKADGVEMLIVGESSDLIFGGMDKLISPKWDYEGFKKRYMFIDPADVLNDPQDMDYLFERYRKDGDKIDYMQFMDDVFAIESSSSYLNAFNVAGMPYFDPYARLIMADPLDLDRVRNGEPKYLIRELMAKKYPEIPVPFKNPMPRPVDAYFANWSGPVRAEFRQDLDMSKFTGNQKWQMWCLERFLNNNEG